MLATGTQPLLTGTDPDLTVTGGVDSVSLPDTQTLDLSGTGIKNTGALESVGGNNVVNGPVILDEQAAFSPVTTPAANVAINVVALTPTDSLTINGVISESPGHDGFPTLV